MASAMLSRRGGAAGFTTPETASGDDKGGSGMDDSLPSSSGSVSASVSASVSTNTGSSTSELEERFQRILTLEAETQHRILEETELDQITQEELDALYAKDMFDLTGAERNDALQDIHGVSDTIAETPEFVAKHRQLLEQELALLVSRPRQKTMAYQRARQQSPMYIGSEQFQLMFLRANKWDTRDAALQLTSFLETKLELFGPDLLTRRVVISDLSKEDRKSLESGFFQLLPVRDVAGRAILMGTPILKQYKVVDNLKRTFFYMVMAALEDEDTQKAGMVMVGYNMGPNRIVDRKAAFAVQSLKRSLPCRMGSIHYCYDDFRLRPMMTVAMLVMGPINRVRFRGHYGSIKEVLYKLNTFGVPSSALPLSDDGEPKTKNHKNWLKLRNSQEQSQASGSLPLSIIVIPKRLDVLLGRGKPIQKHVGNVRYYAILENYQNAYERAKKFQKMKIAQQILDTVKGYGGRFLKAEGAGWVVTDEIVAREKVAHGFRTRRATTEASSAVTLPSGATSSSSPTSDASTSTSAFSDSNKRSNLDTMTTIPEQVPSSTTGGHASAPASVSAATTTTTEEGEKNSGSSLSEDGGTQSGKRVKLWASAFHEVPD